MYNDTMVCNVYMQLCNVYEAFMYVLCAVCIGCIDGPVQSDIVLVLYGFAVPGAHNGVVSGRKGGA